MYSIFISSIIKKHQMKMRIIFTEDSRQARPDGRVPKHPDVPRKDYDPKSLQDVLIPNKKKSKK